MKKILFALGLLFLCTPAFARTCTWDGGDAGALASTAANWDTDTVCVAGDAVVFNGTSADNCTFDLTADFASINTTGYGGVVTASVTTKFSGNITFANSTWAHGNQKIILDAAMTIDPGTAGNTFYDVGVTGHFTFTLTNDIYFTHEFMPDNGLDITWNGADVHFQGDVQSTTPGNFFNFPSGTSDIYIDGSGNQLINFNTAVAGSRAIGNLVVINSSGGTVTMKAAYDNGMNFSGGLIRTAGTVDWTTNSVVPKFVGSQNINLNSMTMPSVTNYSGTLTLTGDLNYGSLTISGTFAPSSYTWTGTGNVTKTGTLTAGTSTAVFNGTSTLSGAMAFYSLTVNSGKTLNLTTGQTFSTNASGTFYAVSATIASTTGTDAIFNMNGSQSVALTTATDIDSSGGSTVHNYLGTNTGTINWDTAAASTPVTTAYTWVG